MYVEGVIPCLIVAFCVAALMASATEGGHYDP